MTESACRAGVGLKPKQDVMEQSRWWEGDPVVGESERRCGQVSLCPLTQGIREEALNMQEQEA